MVFVKCPRMVYLDAHVLMALPAIFARLLLKQLRVQRLQRPQPQQQLYSHLLPHQHQ